MFTGIIENLAKVKDIVPEGGNKRLILFSSLITELKVDQSLAHNGACLTVEKINLEDGTYEVVAVQETLQKTQLGSLRAGAIVNLERSLLADSRIDGHFVQGHIDMTSQLLEVYDANGSWLIRFSLPSETQKYVVPKGSIALNGVSLTVAAVDPESLVVAIVPFTAAHTNLSMLKRGDLVNVEFDMMGKYLVRYMDLRMNPKPDQPQQT